MTSRALLLCSALLLACSCATSENGIVPRPYTTSEIRASNTPGTSLVFRITQLDQPVILQVFEFGETDGEFVELGGRMTDTNGKTLGQAQVARTSWEELRDHATYSPSNTSRSPAEVRVPAGSFDCTLYTVRKDDHSVERYWFAKSRPGPPVLVTTEKKGVEIFRMELASVKQR